MASFPALVALALVAPRGPAPTQAPGALSLDELIARLPRTGEEWDAGAPGRLVPVAQEFRERLDQGARLSPEQWRHALLDTGVLSYRARWPVDVPFTVSMRAAGWFKGHVLELEPDVPEAELNSASVGFPSTHCGFDMLGRAERARHQELGRLELGPHRLAFDLAQGLPFNLRWPTRVPGALTLEVEIVATLDEALPPVTSPALDAAVRRSLALELEETSAGPQFFLRRRAAPAELSRVAIALEVELREAGVVRATTTMREGVDKGSVPLPAALAASPEARADWSLRVRGVAADVLERWWLERRWGGELELPLEDWLAAERSHAPR